MWLDFTSTRVVILFVIRKGLVESVVHTCVVTLFRFARDLQSQLRTRVVTLFLIRKGLAEPVAQSPINLCGVEGWPPSGLP